MSTTKKILQEDWIDYMDSFTSGNKGRKTSIEYYETGKQMLAHDMHLQSIVYDPVEKGNALSISLKSESGEFTHVVDSPVEINEVHNKQGIVIALEIQDSAEVLTLVLFRVE